MLDFTLVRNIEWICWALRHCLWKVGMDEKNAETKTKCLSPVAYKGVFVSLKPRKTPCIANDKRTAGEPRALNVKYFLAGFNIAEPYPLKMIASSLLQWIKAAEMNRCRATEIILVRRLKLKALTDFTPIICRRGFAPNMRNIACTRPRIPPTINAVDAEGICRLSFFCSGFTLSVSVWVEDLLVIVLQSDEENTNTIYASMIW